MNGQTQKSNSQVDRIIAFNKSNVYCDRSSLNYGFSYFASKSFRKGASVLKSIGRIITRQTSCYSMQIDIDKHILPLKWTGRYLNHSCNPNLFVRTRSDGFPDFIAIRNILEGEELTYGYYMTEFKWTSKAQEKHISCKCKSSNCVTKIRSFSDLTDAEKQHLKQNNLILNYLHKL